MNKKLLLFASLAMFMGIVIGGVTIGRISADDTTTETFPPKLGWELNSEEREEMRLQMEEHHAFMENIEREISKTDDGIQINLRGQDTETIQQMHELYDDNGGEWRRSMNSLGGRIHQQFKSD